MKYKGSNKKLTRLILTALFLNSSIYLPVAEAASYTVSTEIANDTTKNGIKNDPIDITSTDVRVLHPATQAENDTVTYTFNGSSAYINNKSIFGAFGHSATDLLRRHVIMSGSGNIERAAGAYNQGTSGTGNVNYCSVTMQGNSSAKMIIGGFSQGGNVDHNTVTISGGTSLGNWGIFGGWSDGSGKSATNNQVIIEGGSFNAAAIRGGQANGTADSNTVAINKQFSGTISEIYGGLAPTSTNNVLSIGMAGIDLGATNVYNTQILKVGAGVAFDPTKVLCKTTGKMTTDSGSTRPEKVDITGLSVTGTSSTGEMTLFQGNTNFGGIQVVKDGTTIISGLTTSEQTVTEDLEPNTESATDHPDVRFTYKNKQTMKVSGTGNKNIIYKNDNPVSIVNLGTVTWTGTARAAGNSFSFNGTTAIDPSALTFSGTASFTNVDPLESGGQSKALLTGATGLTVDHAGDLGDAGVVNTQFTKNNMTFTGTTKGALSVTSGTLSYKLNSGTLTSIDLTGWNGTGFTLTNGWSSGLGDNSITASGFTNPGTTRDIITAKAGFFNNDQITGNQKYSEGTELVDDIAKGVTITGYKTGGVRVKEGTNGATLEFAASAMDGRTIKLGDMTFGDGRSVDNSYNFANTTTVDASNLNFTGFKSPATANTIKATDTMELLSNAKNLAADLPATYASGTSHSQGISYTDSNSVTLSGTLKGNVSTVANEVDYTVTSKTLENISLNGWNGTGGLAIDGSWTPGTGGGIDVDTGTFATPTTGGNVDIFTLPGGFVFGDVTGDKVYKEGTAFSGDTEKGVTFSGTESGGIKKSDDNKKLTYFAETKNTQKIAFGNMTWNDGRTAESNNNFSNVSEINVSNLNFTFNGTDANTIKKTDTMALLKSATGLEANKTVTGTPKSQNISATDATGIKLSGTLTGAVSTSAGQVDYTVTEKTLNKVDLSSWNGTTTSVDTSWEAPEGGVIAVDTGTFTPPTTVNPGTTVDIFTAPTGTTFGNVAGTGAYKEDEVFKGPAKGGVTLEGTTSGGVKKSGDNTKLTYTGIQNSVNKITLGKITNPAAEFGNEYNFAGVTTVDDSGLSFENPENIGNGDNVTLFTSANSSLTPSGSPTDKTVSYSTTPVTGVTLNGQITGSYSNTNSAMTYSATANNAQKLIFGNVEWKDTGALIDHSTTLTKVNFAGASVDTSNINFTNIKELEANKQMTLVSNFGGTPGSITGSKYKVGSTLQGEGKASMDGDNLIFTADTTAEKMQVQEQTHNTLMGASASMTSLAQGNEFINRTMDDMFLSANVGRDGIASFAHIGGGSLRQETGSHVNTRTWNAIVALGHQNKKPRNTFEYGAFVEYGTGNYTTYNGDERGDGSSRYVGGGLLAKWTAPSGLYVEGSLRGGSINDDGHNLLRDVNGVPYSYNVDTPYYGFHLGVGKKIPMKGGNTLDLFAKYFYNHRNSTSFDAGGHYELDAITSQIIRVGARYTVKRDKWNYYGGLAYEHELDGKAGGWADGLAIRGVDTSGGSFRAELGATVTPNEDIPLTLDFNLVGFAGKKQGIFGGMGLKFNF